MKATECFQRKATKLDKQGWKAKALRGWSTSEKRRLKEGLIALYSFLRGRGGGGADLFSLVLSSRTRGNGSELHNGRFRLNTGSISLLRGWSDIGTGFLRRWSMPQVYLVGISVFHYFL